MMMSCCASPSAAMPNVSVVAASRERSRRRGLGTSLAKSRGGRLRGRAALIASASSSSDHAGTVFEYTQVELDTKLGISLHDITPQIEECVAKAGVKNGYVNVLSRHTTTARTEPDDAPSPTAPSASLSPSIGSRTPSEKKKTTSSIDPVSSVRARAHPTSRRSPSTRRNLD